MKEMKGTLVQQLVLSLHNMKLLGPDPLGAPVSEWLFSGWTPPRCIQGQVNSRFEHRCECECEGLLFFGVCSSRDSTGLNILLLR